MCTDKRAQTKHSLTRSPTLFLLLPLSESLSLNRGGAVQSSPLPTSAASVGEGGLPDGARQFSNLLKAQQDWAALGNTMRERGSSLSQEEWKNVALFLRKVYQVGSGIGSQYGRTPRLRLPISSAVCQIKATTNG